MCWRLRSDGANIPHDLLIKSTIGGPLVTEDGDSNFLLMGIVRGGGVDCKTGDWMRVAAFKEVWIDKVIEEETRVGMELINHFAKQSFILGHFSELKNFSQWRLGRVGGLVHMSPDM